MPGLSQIVIRSPNWIGDHIMARPLYRALRAHYPHARITLVHPPALSELVYSDCFNDSLLLPAPARKSLRGICEFAHNLRPYRFDLAVVIPATLRAAVPFFLAGVPERVGFAGDGSALFLTSALRWNGVDSGKHKSELYLELADWLLAARPSAEEPSVAVRLEKRLVIAPGASIALREWPYHKELLSLLRASLPELRLCYVGTGELSGFSQWLDSLKDTFVENRIGQTTLTQLRELCSQAQAVVANDSGVAHLAATLAGAPTVVLFGPGNPRYVTPSGRRVQVVREEELPCSPCEKPYCRAPYGYKACLQQVEPSAVLEAVRRALS